MASEGSLLDADSLSDDVALLARDAAAEVNPREVTIKPMKYEELLTTSQRKQIVEEVCTCFEHEALHLTDRHQWLALRPKEPQWIGARQISQHWGLTMRMCCKQDLKQDEFEELEKSILYGDAMDAQILGIVKRLPKKLPHRHDPGHAH